MYKGIHDAIFLLTGKSTGHSMALSRDRTRNKSLSKKLKLDGNNCKSRTLAA
jgi:hypothetical protein